MTMSPSSAFESPALASAAADPASMSATRSSSKTAPPTPRRDGFHLVPSHPIHYDLDLTKSSEFEDITYHVSTSDHVARIAFNRPHVLHAFRPTTINEVCRALELAQEDTRVSIVVLTSDLVDGRTPAFCARGDQSVRSSAGGYNDGFEAAPRLRVLDLQVQMRRCPKPIAAVVRGYAIGCGTYCTCARTLRWRGRMRCSDRWDRGWGASIPGMAAPTWRAW
ncbi:hypothetical protein ACHAWF_009411 [Thalassiosira exigua]